MSDTYIIQYYKNPLRTTTVVVPEKKLTKTLHDIFKKGGYDVRICVNESLRGKRSTMVEFFDWENEFLNG
jgi:hypothetical protein